VDNVFRIQKVLKPFNNEDMCQRLYHNIMRNKYGFTLKLFLFIFLWKCYHSFITYIKQQIINKAV